MSMHLWNLKKADRNKFKKNSQYFITDDLIDDNNSDTFKNIVESFTSLANETLHCKKKNKNNAKSNKKHRPIPFWNIKCTEAIYNRNKARNKADKSKNLHDYLEYKHQEAIVKVTLKSEAQASWEKYCSELTNQTKLGVVWDMARRMNCRASYNSIPTLISKGLIADNNLDKSNMLAEMYAKTSSKTNYSEQFVEYLSVTENEHAPKPSGNLPAIEDIEAINKKFSLKELKDGICNSKCNKSPGDDKLPYEFFKHLHKDALNVLLAFYNKAWTESEFPDDWHHAIILPLLKPNKMLLTLIHIDRYL